MQKPYAVLEGKNLGIIAGELGENSGVIVYKPTNELVPRQGMLHEELQQCIPPGTSFVNIPYRAIRQVFVNGVPVWRNRDVFDLASMGVNSLYQSYKGRGDVAVEFMDDFPRLEVLVENILIRSMGLQRAA